MTETKPDEKPKLVPKKMETQELMDHTDDGGCKKELILRTKETVKEILAKVYK